MTSRLDRRSRPGRPSRSGRRSTGGGGGGGPLPLDPENIAVGDLAFITTGTAITPSLPSHNEGDLLLLFHHGYSTQNPVAPAGWSTLWSTTYPGADDAVYWKRAGAEESNPTVTVVSATQGGSSRILAVPGVHESTPFDVTPVQGTAAYQTAGAGVGNITPVTNGAVVLCGIWNHVDAGNFSITGPNGYFHLCGPGDAIGGQKREVTIGARLLETAAAVNGFTTNASNSWCKTSLIALRPA